MLMLLKNYGTMILGVINKAYMKKIQIFTIIKDNALTPKFAFKLPIHGIMKDNVK